MFKLISDMKKQSFITVVLGIIFILPGCSPCKSYEGYDRYSLKIGCDRVTINGREYTFTRQGPDLMVDGHSVDRGIYRKTRPWLYVHDTSGGYVDVTFDEGLKDYYPLYTGSLRSFFNVMTQSCDVSESSDLEFQEGKWLVLHRWTPEGVVGDVQQRTGSTEEWNLVRGDILFPKTGIEIFIPELNTTGRCTSFDLEARKADLQFVHTQ